MHILAELNGFNGFKMTLHEVGRESLVRNRKGIGGKGMQVEYSSYAQCNYRIIYKEVKQMNFKLAT